ncbi:class I SAM-dependent methyltransferase family protein [Salinirubellus salinus]|uniref:tRNA(Phe) (4-demethylwyosine(37)-C(7)) aminocarboxypropyltransferase n=1 Tax=Salinirubellus salinus TaxID=1364945 RepID=A0A9E7R0R9_9EURY|nr:class I SAM-dependent methyltransferase family protein [Salinirubellus salinus]UWM53571.1 class I SAM-dependent methyltransferase family protein [Salinirubellus salinus]
MSDSRLAAVVAKPDAEAAIASLQTEGVYDDTRRVEAHDADTVALPVTARPSETAVRDVVESDLPRRERGLHDILRSKGWEEDDLDAVPASWAVVGSVVLVDVAGCPNPESVGEALLALHGEADTVLAREGIAGKTREPEVEVLAGEGDTETVHTEHGTRYAMDLAEVMFSPGNEAERAGMADRVEAGERVFDMFAGIGYFTLPMARAGAEVLAAELRPTAYRYLVENAVLNGVQERVEAYRADCADVAVEEPVDRVVMGHYEAHERLDSAVAALRPGGVLHLHEATPTAELWDRPVGRVEAAAERAGRSVEVLDRRVVKGYSAGVEHVVVDARVP